MIGVIGRGSGGRRRLKDAISLSILGGWFGIVRPAGAALACLLSLLLGGSQGRVRSYRFCKGPAL